MENKMKIGKLEIDLSELTEFIITAKKTCYAGNGEETTLPDGSKRLTLQGENFHYTDNYSGFYQAPGDEIVRWKKPQGQRIWQMSYSGGMLPIYWENEQLAKRVFTFLKEALSSVNPKHPFRGRDSFFSENDSELFYRTGFGGDIRRFKGHEEIVHKKLGLMFSQDYIGGLVIPK